MARDLYRDSFTRYNTVDLEYEIPVWKESTNKDGSLKRISLKDFFASDLVKTVLDPPNWATGDLTLTGIRQHNLGNYSLTLINGTFITAADVNVNMLGTVKLPNAASDNTITKVLGIDSTTGQIKYTTAITNGSIAPMAANTFKANITGATAVPTDVARTDLTNSLPYATDSVVGFTAAGALVRFNADKLLNTMSSQTTSEGSITVDLGSMQVKAVSALGISATIPAPIGTPTNGMSLIYRLKDDGISRALTWNAIFRGVNGVTLPAATLGSTSDLLIIKCLYNSVDSKWDVYFVGGGAGLSDADYGDITVSGSGTTMTIDNDVVSNAKLADVATSTFKGRATAGSGDPEDLTAAQARTILNVEDGADVTDTTNVTAAGALMDSEVTNLAQVKSFDSADYATAAQGALADSAQQPPAEGAFVDGDKTKLDGIEPGATADQTDSEIETAYNNQVAVASQAEAEAGTVTDVRRWTPQRVKQAIDASTDASIISINGKKDSAGTIAKGLPVYLVGFDSDLHTVELADANNASAMPVIGFTGEPFNNTDSKPIITYGKLEGIDTTSTISQLNPNGETWAVNDALYISTNTGGLTKVRPTGSGSLIQRIAKVLKVDATGGQIFVFNTARTAGLPNLSADNIWVGDSNGIPQMVNKSTISPALNNGEVFVGNASNQATSVAMSGDVAITNTGVTTIQPDSVTYDKMQDTTQAALLGNDNPAGGTVNEIPIVDQYLATGTVTALLENTSNWDVNGNYTGASITATYQGQSHYDGNYWFTAVADNVWIRLIRG